MLIDKVHELIEAWKRQDVEAVLAMLDDDVVYHYHVGSPPLEGREKVRRFLERFGKGQEDIRWRIDNHAENGDLLLVEGRDIYRKGGVEIDLPYMGIFRFRDGRILEWRDHFDMGELKKQMDG